MLSNIFSFFSIYFTLKLHVHDTHEILFLPIETLKCIWRFKFRIKH